MKTLIVLAAGCAAFVPSVRSPAPRQCTAREAIDLQHISDVAPAVADAMAVAVKGHADAVTGFLKGALKDGSLAKPASYAAATGAATLGVLYLARGDDLDDLDTSPMRLRRPTRSPRSRTPAWSSPRPAWSSPRVHHSGEPGPSAMWTRTPTSNLAGAYRRGELERSMVENRARNSPRSMSYETERRNYLPSGMGMFGRQAGRRNFWGRSGSRASSRRDYEREYDREYERERRDFERRERRERREYEREYERERRDFERERRDYTRGRSNYARRDEYGQGDEVQRLRRTLDESRRLCLEQSEQRELAELKTRAIERQAGARADESAAAVTRLTARLAEASEALAEASRTGYSIDEAARVRDALEAELVVARAERTLAEAERYQYDQYDVPTATPVMPAQQQR